MKSLKPYIFRQTLTGKKAKRVFACAFCKRKTKTFVSTKQYCSRRCFYRARYRQNRVLWACRRHGISLQQYESLLRKQNGCCALCLRVPKRFCIDHDHSTNIVRGLLCDGCNGGIGQLGDDIAGLRRALSYLESVSKPQQ
jgi:hypothetical protein